VSKYKNIKTVIHGHKFDSRKEALRYSELQILQLAGEISDLELQPRFKIVPAVVWNKKLPARFYVADFKYKQNGKEIVEDVKSEITLKNAVYTLKRQLFLLKYGEKYTFLES